MVLNSCTPNYTLGQLTFFGVKLVIYPGGVGQARRPSDPGGFCIAQKDGDHGTGRDGYAEGLFQLMGMKKEVLFDMAVGAVDFV